MYFILSYPVLVTETRTAVLPGAFEGLEPKDLERFGAPAVDNPAVNQWTDRQIIPVLSAVASHHVRRAGGSVVELEVQKMGMPADVQSFPAGLSHSDPRNLRSTFDIGME